MAHRKGEPAQPSYWQLGPSAVCGSLLSTLFSSSSPRRFCTETPASGTLLASLALCTRPSLADTTFYAGVLSSLPSHPATPASQLPFLLLHEIFGESFLWECSWHLLYETVVLRLCAVVPRPLQQVHRVLGNILDFLKETSVRRHANY